MWVKEHMSNFIQGGKNDGSTQQCLVFKFEQRESHILLLKLRSEGFFCFLPEMLNGAEAFSQSRCFSGFICLAFFSFKVEKIKLKLLNTRRSVLPGLWSSAEPQPSAPPARGSEASPLMAVEFSRFSFSAEAQIFCFFQMLELSDRCGGPLHWHWVEIFPSL